ncbi:hypothetical protein [Bradyrhizobium sp. CSA112]|uniref:hypothetical protein n=1 Tax=Bradyrhizobium sp. CSA112 TaxID=2699170 RepID=UPI0023AFB8BA|nr:hypothetical protein [Bradyrhizobium sp. CSA112]
MVACCCEEAGHPWNPGHDGPGLDRRAEEGLSARGQPTAHERGVGPDLLRMEIRELEALNFDIGKIGFDTGALAKLFDVGEPVEREERQRDSLGEAVIQFNIVFDDAGQQDAWFKLVRNLKQMYSNNDTLGERIKLYVVESFPDA